MKNDKNTIKILKNPFPQYPKIRPVLPMGFQKLYSQHYIHNRKGKSLITSISKRMENWLHKTVAKDVETNHSLSTLEIGAGTLNQFDFENTQPYDIVEPFHSLYKDSIHISKIRDFFDDIDDVPTKSKYDRIISIATFEHITNLPQVVSKTCLLIKPYGKLRVSVPNEGNFLWTLGWKLTTGIEFYLRHHLDYSIFMKSEHLNKADEIEIVLKYFYGNVSSKSFGICKHLAFYRYFECSEPKPEIAIKFSNH